MAWEPLEVLSRLPIKVQEMAWEPLQVLEAWEPLEVLSRLLSRR